LDWATVGILALLVVMDGWRRVPAGALVLRKPSWAPWRVLPSPRNQKRPRLLSWPAPFGLTILLRNQPDAAPAAVAPRELVGRAALPRALGGLTTLLLVPGVPLATRWLDAAGFFAAAGLVVLFSLGTAAAAVLLARGAAPERDRSVGWALPVASPFGAARAAEVFLERVLAGRTPLAVARELMDERDFAAWIRPVAFDHLKHADGSVPGLESVVDREVLIALIETRPEQRDGARAFCPRCGEAFTDPGGDCPACSVALVAY
jgi:hypothetical protein